MSGEISFETEPAMIIDPLEMNQNFMYTFSSLALKTITANLSNIIGDNIFLNQTIYLPWPVIDMDVVVKFNPADLFSVPLCKGVVMRCLIV